MGLSLAAGTAGLRARAVEICLASLTASSVTDVGYQGLRRTQSSYYTAGESLRRQGKVFVVGGTESMNCLLLCEGDEISGNGGKSEH